MASAPKAICTFITDTCAARDMGINCAYRDALNRKTINLIQHCSYITGEPNILYSLQSRFCHVLCPESTCQVTIHSLTRCDRTFLFCLKTSIVEPWMYCVDWRGKWGRRSNMLIPSGTIAVSHHNGTPIPTRIARDRQYVNFVFLYVVVNYYSAFEYRDI